jgi:hypothetical protein
MIARRKRSSKGRRQEYAYSPMIWIKDADTRRQVWGGTFRTKAEAKVEERRLLQDRDAGANFKLNKLTVAEVFQQYVAEKRNKVKASTLQRTEELLAHLTPLIGATQLQCYRPPTSAPPTANFKSASRSGRSVTVTGNYTERSTLG